jgi:hypothetical protein
MQISFIGRLISLLTVVAIASELRHRPSRGAAQSSPLRRNCPSPALVMVSVRRTSSPSVSSALKACLRAKLRRRRRFYGLGSRRRLRS